jgi:DNA-binding transcriptional MerR regulator
VSSRTYLSIGDVLTLLREEFPDVTISKIRFLESQGLVNPERSPSGYRKFFEHDVERLRWVLRQQREHFLPLKVIRDRLDAGDLDDDGPAGDAAAGAGESVANGKQGEAGASSGESLSSSATAANSAATTADDEAMARILADASRRAALRPEAAPATGTAGAPVVPEDRVGAHPAAESRRQRERERSSASAAAAPATASSATATERDQAGEGARDRGRDGAAGTENPQRLPAASGDNPAGAAGTGRAHGLAGLESFGLVEAMMVAGLRTYDEDALTVANLAASFRGFGIEPRHLRQYRNAADREMGLIEQVVIPLLRQRNPESRQRAADAAEQLATLGQSMRSTLLRSALRRHLGG